MNKYMKRSTRGYSFMLSYAIYTSQNINRYIYRYIYNK